MFGVSPAFVLSAYGQGFSVADFCEALPRIRRLGFAAYQPEIFFRSALAEWQRDGAAVQRAANDLGLVPTQFVAHFMLEHFALPDRLGSEQGCDDLKRVLDIVQVFPACRVMTLPVGQVAFDWTAPWATTADGWRAARRRLVDQIARYVSLVSEAGIRLAFEIMPFSIVGGLARFVSLCDEVGSPALGLNFDAGHAWACRELVPCLPFELEGRIFGTHLGDNLSAENIKLPPGRGTIPWLPLLRNLRAAGYRGSFDLEIGCPAERVEEDYGAGLAHLASLGLSENGDLA